MTPSTLLPPKPVIKQPKINKSAQGLYGNVNSFQNYGQYRGRTYNLSDTNQGLDTVSRENLVKWSREITAQMPWINAAIRILAQYSVGNAYLPTYNGDNAEWGKVATDWLKHEFYPNCSTRGPEYDFQNLLYLESCMLDQDGDVLCIYGLDANGFPKVQMIPSHRVRSYSKDNIQLTEGPFKGSFLSDGIIYDTQGRAIGYNIANPDNMVSSVNTTFKEVQISSRDAHLIFDTRQFDKSRGIPSVGSGILQALNVQELDTYLTERIKVESTVALIEKNDAGEAPYELSATLAALEASGNAPFGAGTATGVRMVQGSNIRYVKSDGGEIKSLASSTPGNETSGYIQRLETHILSAIGVPHQLLFSTDQVGGRVTNAMIEVLKSAISRRQKVLDTHAKFVISWALSVAMEKGLVPKNNKENIHRVIGVTHPKEVTLDEGYSRQADIADLAAGVKTLDDIARKSNTTAKEIIKRKGEEAIEFFNMANDVATKTGVDVNTVLGYLKNDIKIAIKGSETASPNNINNISQTN